MAEKVFMRFHEVNDWEDASWDWWLQVDGNEVELRKLAELLKPDGVGEDEDDASFELQLSVREPESVVDKLVQYADENYYAAHNKLTGTFTCPDAIDEHTLYKGGITKLFTRKEAK